MAVVSANKLELLQIADAVAREKSIDRSIVIQAMEDAIAKAARSRYGSETDVHAEIDPKKGELRLARHMLVVETVENPANQISLDDARKHNPAAQVGDTIADTLPPLEYGRIAAQSAKQVIVQKVREAERDRQYQEFKDRIGDIVNGIVKRVEYGNVVVDLGRGEAIVRRDELLPREVFRNGDRIRAYIYDVRREPRGPQIFLSRTHPQFMAKLFAQEVPEIYDGIVEVKAVARDPGSRAKIAVISRDSSVDPVGACVGMRGSRVQAVVNELQGEKIDIIPWSPDIATFVVNALAPAEVAKVVLDEDKERIAVVVPDQQLSLAIGRRGQNVRLASQLTGWDIDILTEQEESERRQADFEKRSNLFMEALNVDEVVGQLLASEGFTSVEDLAMVDEKDIASIEGFDEETAGELQARAQEYLAQIEAEYDAKRVELGVADEVREVPGVTTKMLVAFGENDVKTVEDLAGCATDDLAGWTERKDGETKREPGILDGFELSRDECEEMIMQARVKAGWISEADLHREVEEEAETEGEETDEATEGETDEEAAGEDEAARDEGAEDEAGEDEAGEGEPETDARA
ncbi:Transcription termination protein NusA [Rhodovulum sp. PH10]|uniref:transcription termination factor NusA n=1 Tax=Rhodovulum sp. PH10 TaxID=1187851 RepID=UPI00027C2D63|nr:transcription termination factor NusA [Rhodovulum sp. PH10]EJW09966.1 Transcription termination protein NusA [Rhodovulum sp. PH10]